MSFSEKLEPLAKRGLHSTVVMLNGDIIGEAYFPGQDEDWGRPIGIVEHSQETLHDTRSVTKSVVGLLYGIALSEGVVPSLDARVLEQFPEYADLKDGTEREDITVKDLLTMRMGTAWDESLPYSDPRNSEIAMEMAEDRYRFILEQPMKTSPGQTWNYNGGATALLAKMIEDGTGVSIDMYAGDRLFDPLSIEKFEWSRGADGAISAASGLRLSARDLAKVGMAVAQGGKYGERQVIPADWVKNMSSTMTSAGHGIEYSLHWYVTKGPAGDPILFAMGNGGQRLTVQQRTRFVVASFAGNYNDPNAWRVTLNALVKHAIPLAQNHSQRKDE